jgi:hypothetical protein
MVSENEWRVSPTSDHYTNVCHGLSPHDDACTIADGILMANNHFTNAQNWTPHDNETPGSIPQLDELDKS